MVTDPLQLLSYLAGVTERVDLGTMVVVLPWHNPVRVAEDIVMLDALLGERKVIAGVGRGLGRREYGGLGIDQNEARGRFDEGVARHPVRNVGNHGDLPVRGHGEGRGDAQHGAVRGTGHARVQRLSPEPMMAVEVRPG